MDQASYLANKIWELAGEPRLPVNPSRLFSYVRARFSGTGSPGALLIRPWNPETAGKLTPPAAAIQLFDNPFRIDCRYLVQAQDEDNRYLEAFLAGCALMGLGVERGKLVISAWPDHGERFQQAHQFARTLLAPDRALEQAFEDTRRPADLAPRFQIPVSLMVQRIAELTDLSAGDFSVFSVDVNRRNAYTEK